MNTLAPKLPALAGALSLIVVGALIGGCAGDVSPGPNEGAGEVVASAAEALDWHCVYDCWAVENVACHDAAGAALDACCAGHQNDCTPCASPYWAAMAACDAAIPACVAACQDPPSSCPGDTSIHGYVYDESCFTDQMIDPGAAQECATHCAAVPGCTANLVVDSIWPGDCSACCDEYFTCKCEAAF